ncbi:Crp/Fnr family transcriptional regulator [Rhizobium sp. 21-4511-3d]
MPTQIGNTILSSLPRRELIALEPLIERVPLAQGRVIEASRKEIESVWFMEQGLASMFIEADRYKSVEVGMVGYEGLVGSSVLNGVRKALTKTIIQVPGTAWRIDAEDFVQMLPSCPQLENSCRDFYQNLVWQMAGTALSNARGHIEQRLARWLLMCQDRIGGVHIRITHDYLAAMLGVRRPGVTNALHTLEGEGFVRSTRVNIEILDRQRLEAFAGSFYGEAERMRQHRTTTDGTQARPQQGTFGTVHS